MSMAFDLEIVLFSEKAPLSALIVTQLLQSAPGPHAQCQPPLQVRGETAPNHMRALRP